MKVRVLFLMALGVLVLAACSGVQGVQAEFVQLPDTVKADITAVVLVAVSWGFAKLITMVKQLKFLEQFQVPLALAIASQIIGFIETATPDAYGSIVILALQLGLAILALVFTADKLKAKGYRLF